MLEGLAQLGAGGAIAITTLVIVFRFLSAQLLADREQRREETKALLDKLSDIEKDNGEWKGRVSRLESSVYHLSQSYYQRAGLRGAIPTPIPRAGSMGVDESGPTPIPHPGVTFADD